jgi:hypothetical protein
MFVTLPPENIDRPVLDIYGWRSRTESSNSRHSWNMNFRLGLQLYKKLIWIGRSVPPYIVTKIPEKCRWDSTHGKTSKLSRDRFYIHQYKSTCIFRPALLTSRRRISLETSMFYLYFSDCWIHIHRHFSREQRLLFVAKFTETVLIIRNIRIIRNPRQMIIKIIINPRQHVWCENFLYSSLSENIATVNVEAKMPWKVAKPSSRGSNRFIS